jgi:hypothetical protein
MPTPRPQHPHGPQDASTPPPQPAPPPAEHVELGFLSIDAAPGWRFYPLDDRIVGRPADGVGVIQIVRLPDGALLSASPSHEQCMAAAVVASGYEVSPPGTDRAQEWAENCLAGGESFRSRGDFVRVWYRHCPEGVLAAWFACKSSRARERGVIKSANQCDRMVATLRLTPPVS